MKYALLTFKCLADVPDGVQLIGLLSFVRGTLLALQSRTKDGQRDTASAL
jgi:hypothetical protein